MGESLLFLTSVYKQSVRPTALGSGIPGPPAEWHHTLLFAPSPLCLCLPLVSLLFFLMTSRELGEQRGWKIREIQQRFLGSRGLGETGEGPRWSWAELGLGRDVFPAVKWHPHVLSSGDEEQMEDRDN